MENKSLKHTPTPWGFSGNVIMAGTEPVAIMPFVTDKSKIKLLEVDANQRFIVNAVNNHDRMLRALKAVLVTLGDDDIYAGVQETYETVQEAIAKAEKGA